MCMTTSFVGAPVPVRGARWGKAVVRARGVRARAAARMCAVRGSVHTAEVEAGTSAPALPGTEGGGGGGGGPPEEERPRWQTLAGAAVGTAAAGAAMTAGVNAGLLPSPAQVLADPHTAVAAGLGMSALVQTLTGFGFAIVSVGALTQLDWIAHSSIFELIQPIAATLSGAIAWTLIGGELDKVKWKEIWPLLLSSTLMTPVGSTALKFFDPATVLHVLGALIAGYVAFSVSNVKVPESLASKPGAWLMGGIAGFFGGAFDITGPALVVYGQAAKWTDDFRRNLLTVVAVNSTVVVGVDLLEGRMEDFYYLNLLSYSLPAVVVGMIAGNYISKKIDPAGFKKLVLATCFILGCRLMLT